MSLRRIGVALALAAFTTFSPGESHAAPGNDPELSIELSSRRVEAGEPFTITLRVSGDPSASPQSPSLRGVPSDIGVAGPSSSTSTSIQIINGRTSASTSVGYTWELVASKPGRYEIPAPTVVVNGARSSGKPIAIEVVPSTGRGGQRQGGGSLLPGGPMGFPFGGFGGLGGRRKSLADLLDLMEGSEAMDAAELAMDRAPDAQVFLRAIADKQAAVVGEQVTVSFYVYRRADVRPVADKKPGLADFLRVPLLSEPSTSEIRAVAGGKRYLVTLVDRVALFPLKSGDLHTGPLTWVFDGGRERASNDVVVRVTEPPAKGRPASYVLGDVGRFSLSANVAPRRTDEGGTIAVTLKLAGVGNPPPALKVPARTGVEWLDPERREAIEPQGNVVQGSRTFGYVVRLANAGTVDLGKVELPYWNPASKKYETASVALGSVEVTPSTTAGAAGSAKAGGAKAEPERDAFAGLPRARKELGAYTPKAGPMLEGGRFYGLVLAPPAALALAVAGAAGVRAMRARRESGEQSPASKRRAAFAAAEAARAAGDAKGLAAALERATHLAIEEATGVVARGALVSALAGELERRGVDRPLGARAARLLGDLEAVRFDPGATRERLAEIEAEARAVAEAFDAVELPEAPGEGRS